jgi:hypothetical protein
LKSSIPIFSCLVLLTGWAVAQTPKKAPLSKYTTLWTNSPFTSKPPPPEAGPESNPLDDYALAGVSPISGGYRVTLIHKKTPDERITVDTDNPKSQFKVVSVSRKPGDPLGTTVTLTNGDIKGTVSYDDKLLTLVAAPQAAPQAPPGVPIPGQPQVPPGQPQLQRQPRPRVVPPPPAQPGQPGQQVQPGQPQIQQGQPAQQGSQRPERRRN